MSSNVGRFDGSMFQQLLMISKRMSVISMFVGRGSFSPEHILSDTSALLVSQKNGCLHSQISQATTPDKCEWSESSVPKLHTSLALENECLVITSGELHRTG